MHNRQNFIDEVPNISIESIKDVSGQFVTPQKTLTIPQAAHNPIGRPNIGARKLPRVAPIKRVGTISPPLKPPPKVTEVKSIFNRQAYHGREATKLFAMTLVPAPR